MPAVGRPPGVWVHEPPVLSLLEQRFAVLPQKTVAYAEGGRKFSGGYPLGSRIVLCLALLLPLWFNLAANDPARQQKYLLLLKTHQILVASP